MNAIVVYPSISGGGSGGGNAKICFRKAAAGAHYECRAPGTSTWSARACGRRARTRMITNNIVVGSANSVCLSLSGASSTRHELFERVKRTLVKN